MGLWVNNGETRPKTRQDQNVGYPESKPTPPEHLPIALAVPVDAGDWAAGQVDAPPTPLPTGASPVEVKLSPASPEGSPGRSPEAAATFISGLAFCLQQRCMRGGGPRALASLPASVLPGASPSFLPANITSAAPPSLTHPALQSPPRACPPCPGRLSTQFLERRGPSSVRRLMKVIAHVCAALPIVTKKNAPSILPPAFRGSAAISSICR